MKHVKKSVLLWYSPAEMYTLVTAVQDYPQFLPWCERAEVLEEHTAGMTARLHMALSGLRHAFTTRNVHVQDESVVVELVDGPFSSLDGHWKFLALSQPAAQERPQADDIRRPPPEGGEEPSGGRALPQEAKACRIEFNLRYAFSNGVFEAVLSPVFDRVANTLVDSFVKRAEQVYGPR